MADPDDRPEYSFNPGPPPEASRFLKNKGLRPSFGFEDVEPEEHAVAFAVAKVMEIDLLEAMQGEILKALDEGLPLATFQKSWRANPRLAEWWGKREMTDPLTGETKEVQLGSPRRLRTIYNANIRSARAAGQWERIERTKAAFPFLEYRTGPSEHHRPHHLDKAGLILPVASAFWDEWLPPNGWGCKCWVRQVTKAEAARRGVSVAPDVPDRVVPNDRTGETRLVPVGIDPGWQRNPGKLRMQHMDMLLRGRLEDLPAPARKVALRDLATSWRVQRLATQANAVGNAPIGYIPDAIAAAAKVPVQVVEFSASTRRHVFEDKSDRRIEDLGFLAALDEASRIAVQMRPGWAHPRLIFELDTAMDPTSPDPYHRNALRIAIVIKQGGSYLSTFWRVGPSKWANLIAQDGVEVLKD
jgi:hypothetical protein